MDCMLWMDMRGAAHLRRQFGGPLSMQGISLPRIRRWVKLTGGMPSPTGKDPSAHMLYIRDELPHVYERTYKFLGVLDYLNLRLTGRMVATSDSIVTSWVTDNRGASGVRYDPGLVRDCAANPDARFELEREAIDLDDEGNIRRIVTERLRGKPN
jgi:xylulokinase